MIDLNEIRVILWGFDDTLCFHSTYLSRNDHIYNMRVLECGVHTWNACSKNKQLQEFMWQCENMKIEQGLMSEVISSKHAEAKVDWVSENYGIDLGNYCVSSQANKLDIMKALADIKGIKPNKILLIDDKRTTLTMAANAGFSVLSPIHIINYIEGYKGDIKS